MRRATVWTLGSAAAAGVALVALPLATVVDDELSLHAWQLPVGWLLLALAVATGVCAGLLAKHGERRFAWGVVAGAAGTLGALAWLYVDPWSLVPCSAAGSAACDAQAGGLVDGTLVTLDVGFGLAATSAVLAALSALVVLAGHPTFRATDRFLRLRLLWDGTPIVERVLFQREAVTVGEADGVTVQLAAEGLQRHELLTPAAGGWELSPPRGVRALLARSGEPAEAVTGDHTDITSSDAGLLHFDNGLCLAFDFIRPSTQLLGGAGEGRDRGLWLALAVTAVVALALLTATGLTLRGHRVAFDEGVAPHERELIELTLADDAPPPPPPEEAAPGKEDDEKVGKRAGGEEGTPGEPEADPTKKTKIPLRDGSTEQRPVNLRNVGVAQALNDPRAQEGALGAVLSGAGPVARTPTAPAMNGEGSELVIGPGSNGMGFRGTGPGGGDPSIGGRLHGVGPIDTGPGHGRSIVIGTGPRPRARVRPVDEREAPMPSGGCDRGDIAKQVRARAASFRTCYELQLVSRPDLSGKMTVRWTIAEDGRARSVSTTQDSVGSDAVSSCVLRAFERMSFQKPEAGVCVVQWPLVFTN